ncbi:hypothetical protein FHT70_006004 [Rhizobium sp. BK049]|uniref:hypothetical protein n=1 Tax=Rhizobium sp. BK049 TaxID=2587095 RepID=UPI001615DDB8|nr:hypothetical protein [Rhizobium sp. BK049]MBB3356031.1 hypothetical protein [Rhizobium sp. BK049]
MIALVFELIQLAGAIAAMAVITMLLIAGRLLFGLLVLLFRVCLKPMRPRTPLRNKP